MFKIKCNNFHTSSNSITINANMVLTSGSILMNTFGLESKEDIRKGKVMENLFHVGVVFKHKGSKVLWKVLEVVKDEDGLKFVRAISLSSGYKKAFWPSAHSYDSMDLHEAPDAIRVLYGDKKHDSTTITQTDRISSQAPQTPDIAFEETDLSEIDPSGD